MAEFIVIALRLVLPLTILRWPLAGGLLSMLIDALDVALVDALARLFGEPPEFGPIYAQLDKVLDTWYLTLELIVTRRWTESLLRRTALVLYVWRLIGAILFELTALHPILLVFPNLFENFYLYILIMWRLRRSSSRGPCRSCSSSSWSSSCRRRSRSGSSTLRRLTRGNGCETR